MAEKVGTGNGDLSIRKKLIFTSAVMVIALALGLAAAEALIRHTSPYVTPELMSKHSLQYAPALFARHVFPRKEQRTYDTGDISTGIEFYVNEKGYRGRDFPAAKPDGVIRIIVYGGSAAFDINLPEGRDWPHRVEAILRESGYPQVEVINAGIPGHASFDAFGRLFSEGHTFSPDYVISYNEWNDIKYFRSNQPLLREFKPFCQVRNLRLDYRGPVDRFLCERSQLYAHLRMRYYDWRLRVGPQGAAPQGEHSSELSGAAIRQYALNQRMFVDVAREIGAVPILMTEGRLATRDSPEGQRARIEYDYVKLDHQTLVRAYDRMEEVIRGISSEKGVELIDVSGALNGRDEYFSDVVHLSPEGSEVLARLTAQRLIEILKAESQSGSPARRAAPR
jgi:hypothetical protein